MAETKFASERQRKLFFALVHDLGYDPEVAKERAKNKFGLDSFASITTSQLSSLIETLQDTLAQKKQGHVHNFLVTARDVDRIYSVCTLCPAIMIEFRSETAPNAES